MVNAGNSGAVTAEAIGEKARNSTDSGHTDPGEVVDLAIGQALLQVFDNLPAVHEGLEFGWGAQVLKEISALIDAIKADDGIEQGALGAGLLAIGFVSIRFHSCMSVLTR